MVTVTTQICLLLSALYSLVYSQPVQPTDPNFGNPFSQTGVPGGAFDPNLIPNTGTAPIDPNIFPNMGNPGMTGPYPYQPAPLSRPNPMQSMLPLLMFRGGDMAQMLAMMSMFGGGGGGGGLGMNPLLLMGLLGNM